jgi:hypothetical protein
MEAMSLGKPVIATAWSGNLSFMNHTNSCLVGCDLIPVEASIDAYAKKDLGEMLCGLIRMWKKPQHGSRNSLQILVCEPRIGKRAAEDMAKYQDRARKGEFIDELIAIDEQRTVTAGHAAEKARLLEFLQQQIVLENQRRLRTEMTVTRRTYDDVKRLLDRHLLWRFNKLRDFASSGA